MIKMKNKLKRIIAKISGKNYVEDFVRVYPCEKVFNQNGELVGYTKEHRNNYLNHTKFYQFASQFVQKDESLVLDAGCGSGYGAKILKESGALEVDAFDLSEHAIEFARNNFSQFANFRIAAITNLKSYGNKKFDLITCSEVLEHIKEYGREREALLELKVKLKNQGTLVLGTPNDEMLPNHGFSFNEINSLFKSIFGDDFLIIENALLPPAQRETLWEERVTKDEIGIRVNQNINFEETVIDPLISSSRCKNGEEIIDLKRNDISVNFDFLHNTHSWIVIARKTISNGKN